MDGSSISEPQNGVEPMSVAAKKRKTASPPAKRPAARRKRGKGRVTAAGRTLGAPDRVARTDGLRPGSKMAIMIDMVLRSQGATESEICKKIGWKKCRVTLKRTAEKIGATLTHEKGPTGEFVYKATVPPAKK